MHLLRFFQERFGFTRTELMVIMLLTISLLIGTAIRQFREPPVLASHSPSPAVDSQFVRGARAFHDALRRNTRVPPDTAGHLSHGVVDLNSADEAALIELPGIGPAIARRILAYRREHGVFSSVKELQNVRGIGPKTLERLRQHVSVSTQRRNREPGRR
jgi:comEA protein